MKWNDEKQARLDALRTAELTAALDQAGQAELTALIESLEAEERERLSAALAQIKSEQAALRRQIQESEDENEQLVILAAQMERLLIDGRRVLDDLKRRHQSIRETYRHVTGEPLSAVV
jgi:uncharacterized protein YpuA (DUF1002 family)